MLPNVRLPQLFLWLTRNKGNRVVKKNEVSPNLFWVRTVFSSGEAASLLQERGLEAKYQVMGMG